LLSALVGRVASGGLFEEAHGCAGDAANVASRVGGDNGEKAGTGFFGEVGFFEHALGGVDIREVEGGAGVARVEDGG